MVECNDRIGEIARLLAGKSPSLMRGAWCSPCIEAQPLPFPFANAPLQMAAPCGCDCFCMNLLTMLRRCTALTAVASCSKVCSPPFAARPQIAQQWSPDCKAGLRDPLARVVGHCDLGRRHCGLDRGDCSRPYGRGWGGGRARACRALSARP